MTLHLGKVPASSTLYIPFDTTDGGGSVTISGLAVTDIEIYKNGSTTQRASDNGYTLLDTDGVDFDGITGIHGFSIDLSNNSDSGFYAVGSFYWVVVSSITVAGQTHNFIAATFRIGPAESVTGYEPVDAAYAGGTAWNSGAIKTTSFTSGAIDAAALAADAGTEIGTAVWATTTRLLTAGTNIQLPSNGLANVTAWTVAITGNVTGNLSGSVGSVTARVTANTDQVNGTAQTAGDLYAAISGIGTAGGAAINTDSAADNASGGISGVTSGTTKVGTQTNTRTNTAFLDGSYHIITGTATALDWVYQFTCGGGTTVVSVVWTGYVNSANDIVTVSAWNHVGGAWEAITTIQGIAGTVNSVRNVPLFPRHIGTSTAELGKVYVRFHCTGMTNPVLNTDQLYVTYAVTSRTVGYADGAVWIDTNNGVAGTEAYVNGTADHPSNTLANGITIATAVGLKRLHFVSGSSITLTGAFPYQILGDNVAIDLNGQDISGAVFESFGPLTGTATGTVPIFNGGPIGNVTLPPCVILNSGFTGTLTVGATGDYLIANCHSQVPGASTPVIDFAAGVGATNMSIRKWSGGLRLDNVQAGDIISVDAISGGTVTVNGTGGTVHVRGMVRVVDGSSGTVSITQTQAINSLNINAEVDTAISDAGLTDVGDNVSDLALIHGLVISNPMTVTPTSRTAGTIAQTISGDGTTTSTVTRTA